MAIERTRFEAATLRGFAARALEAVGVDADDARLVGEVLVASDLRGIESHGVARLEGFYVDRIRDGRIDPQAGATTLRETPTSLSVDANNGLGHPVGVRTMRRTIEKAQRAGCAIATVRRSNHFGIAGYYAMLALESDCIGVVSTNAGRLAAPTGGREPMLGTNPFAFAVPAEDGDSFVLDMATTTVALGKLEIAKRLGKPLQRGWAVDRDGNDTTDPDAGLLGALLPLGGLDSGHKGFALAILIEALTAGLAGYGRVDSPAGWGATVFVQVLDPEAFGGLAAFKRQMDALADAAHSSKPRPGVDRVRLPGERGLQRFREQTAHGVALYPTIMPALAVWAKKYGVPLPAAMGA